MGKNVDKKEIMCGILDAAFYGGIAYWCSFIERKGEKVDGVDYLSEVVGNGGTMLLTEEESGKVFELNPDNFWIGIEKASDHFGKTVQAFYDNHDASHADVAVQFALFGEIIYA